MARGPRLDYPGARHHVMNRGAGRQIVFGDDEACGMFIALLEEVVDRYDFVVHGYSLMPNHFHLMLQTPRGNLSRGMRHLASRYAMWLSEAKGWDGPAFRGRFKSRLVEHDAYWMHLLAYLHLNPVRAGLVNRLDQALFTSHNAYVGNESAPDWLTVSELQGFFLGIGGYEQYVADVRKGAEQGPEVFDEDNLFVRQRREQMEKEATEPPKLEPQTFSAEQAMVAVRLVTGIRVPELLKGRAGRGGNPARWLAMWWLAHAAQLTQGEIAEMFGTTRAAVCRSVARVRGSLNQETELSGWAKKLIDLLD